MTEQEIYEILCEHLMVLDKTNPMDDPFFKHCYDVCNNNKNKLSNVAISDIVERELKLLRAKEQKIINDIKLYQ